MREAEGWRVSDVDTWRGVQWSLLYRMLNVFVGGRDERGQGGVQLATWLSITHVGSLYPSWPCECRFGQWEVRLVTNTLRQRTRGCFDSKGEIDSGCGACREAGCISCGGC